MTTHHLIQHISYSPLVFLFSIIIGVMLSVHFPIGFTEHTLRALAIGGVLLAVAPLILVWGRFHQIEDFVAHASLQHHFGCGPFRYSRHPKYVAFVLMVMGMGFVMNSVILLIMTGLLVLLFSFVIIPHEEKLLIEKYPDRYPEYRRKTPMWF